MPRGCPTKTNIVGTGNKRTHSERQRSKPVLGFCFGTLPLIEIRDGPCVVADVGRPVSLLNSTLCRAAGDFLARLTFWPQCHTPPLYIGPNLSEHFLARLA
ncbi:hypothetical protein QR685DRAFT_596685 [Neurospora intermedia]|uniref:Uncharacterized protein n=1 Tax=Neurospora intermedia TaxID=5142 RepID=A0ABR3DJJ8_NEUIN